MRFVHDCKLCGKRLKAETRTVLNMVIATHTKACAARCARLLEEARAKSKQGSLF